MKDVESHRTRVSKSVFGFALCALLFTHCASADAQQVGKVFRIGILLPWSPTSEVSLSFLKAFREGLRELGHVENRDVAIELRYGEGVIERLPGLAAELVRLPVDLIVTSAGPPALATKLATNTIPIVFTQVSDPVGEGLIASLARPGGGYHGFIANGSGSGWETVGAFERSFAKNLPCRCYVAIEF